MRFFVFFSQTVGKWQFKAVILQQIYTDKLRKVSITRRFSINN